MGFTTLHLAAREGLFDMCKLLISKGIDENIRDHYGFSASYWAMQNGHKEVIELLPKPYLRSKEEYFANLKVL